MMATVAHSRPAMPLAELLGPIVLPGYEPETIMVSGVQLDSRKVAPGDLFFALPGECHDGRQFIEQAVAQGAVAVVAEPPVAGYVDEVPVPLVELPELAGEVGVIAARFYGNPSHSLQMIGVTGTNGKTTTTWLAAQLLRMTGRRCGVVGTLGATLGPAAAEALNTTPDAISLQDTLSRWGDEGVDAVCMEVSSHALVQGRVSGVDFDAAVFTNLTQDHLDYHGTMAAYGRAKMQLFALEGLSRAVVNLDDSHSAAVMAVLDDGTELLTYSAQGNPAADIVVEKAEFHSAGVAAHIRSPWGSGQLESPLVGDFNLANLAAALGVVGPLNDDFPALLASIRNLQPVPGRMQLIPNQLGVSFVVDYAHTPDALEKVLDTLRKHTSAALLTVFGCGGDRDRSKRAVMGRVACEYSDRVWVTSDNPRGEDPLAILADIESGCCGDYTLVVDRAEAIAQAVAHARPGDCVLVAGKGHEDYQIIAGQRCHFSDEEQLMAAIGARGGL